MGEYAPAVGDTGMPGPPPRLTPGLSLQDSHYLMPIGLEEADAGGHRTVTETKLFKCPVDFLGKG